MLANGLICRYRLARNLSGGILIGFALAFRILEKPYFKGRGAREPLGTQSESMNGASFSLINSALWRSNACSSSLMATSTIRSTP